MRFQKQTGHRCRTAEGVRARRLGSQHNTASGDSATRHCAGTDAGRRSGSAQNRFMANPKSERGSCVRGAVSRPQHGGGTLLQHRVRRRPQKREELVHVSRTPTFLGARAGLASVQSVLEF